MVQRRSVDVHQTDAVLVKQVEADLDLDEDCQAVVGVASSVQVVLVLLGDVRHHHVDQGLHGVMEGC